MAWRQPQGGQLPFLCGVTQAWGACSPLSVSGLWGVHMGPHLPPPSAPCSVPCLDSRCWWPGPACTSCLGLWPPGNVGFPGSHREAVFHGQLDQFSKLIPSILVSRNFS